MTLDMEEPVCIAVSHLCLRAFTYHERRCFEGNFAIL